MKYTPKKNKKGSLVSLLFTLIGGAGLVFSVTTAGRFSLYFQLISLFLFVIGFEFLYRYEMTTFVYMIDDNNFVIIKEVGKKKTCVCNLAMCTAIAILQTPKKKKDKKAMEKAHGRVSIRYNHAQTMHPRHPYSLLFDFNDRVAEIVFEPSEQMIAALQARIAENANATLVME